MPESFKYIYHGPPPPRLEDVERLQPVFRRAYPVNIVWLDGKPVRAERVHAAEPGSPWQRLIDWLRTLLGLEGGRSWAIAARDARRLIKQRQRIERAWWSARRPEGSVATDRTAADARAEPGSRAHGLPVTMQVPTHVLSVLWRQVCRFLQPDDVLALATVSKDAKRAMVSQSLVARAMREVSNAASLSAMLAVIDDMASWHRRQDPAWPVPMADRTAVLAALAARVRVLLNGQQPAACAALLDAAERLDHAGARAGVLAAIATALNPVCNAERHAIADRLLGMILALPAELQYAALSAVLDSPRPREAGLAFTALTCTAENWLTVVVRLPASERVRAGRNLLRALFERGDALAGQGMLLAGIEDAVLSDAEGGASDRAASRAILLETLGNAWVPSGDAAQDEARWRSLFQQACALPASMCEPFVHGLRGRLRELPEPAALACTSAFRAWIETASLSASQRVDLGAGLIHLLPLEDRGVYWHARWADWRNGRYDDEAHAVRLAGKLINMLWCVPSLAGWPAPLDDRHGGAPLAPALRARLLTMLPLEAMRDEPRCLAAVLEESMWLAVRHDSPRAALWWYMAGSLSRGQRREVESLLRRMEPARLFDALHQVMQGEASSPNAAALAMRRLETPRTSAQEGPARIRLAMLMAWHYEREIRAGGALRERLGHVRTLTGELEASAPVQGQEQKETQQKFATAVAVLGNTTAMAAGLSKRRDEVHAADAIVQRIWSWIERTPASMRMAVVQALLDRNAGSRRNTDATFYDYLSRSSLAHMIGLVARSAASVPTAQRGELLVELASAHIEAGSSGFNAARQAQWNMLRSAVPAGHRLRMLAAAGPWLTRPPENDSLRSMWLDCLADYAALCDRLPAVDQPCVAHWRGLAKAALSPEAAPAGAMPIAAPAPG
ncbi:F-box domain-containing protein [Cupriavidus sp. H18C1]|uniref:hypothetical protein n=1 Tax=Cupriavidus sp. H18C1 TaxID=3241601 RepID=UPI003BB8E9B9